MVLDGHATPTCLVLSALLIASSASAERPDSVFGVAPVADETLAITRGAATPFAPLSRAQLTRVADVQARTDVRTFGTAQYQIDQWWGTTGLALIGAAVRQAPN